MNPTPVEKPIILAASQSALELLGAPSGFAESLQGEGGEVAAAFSGNTAMPGAVHAAHCYCGHQFGHFAGQLGDGAAIYVGKVGDWEVQFKGAGLTPYSRSADGRKVLRSTLREYLASEHMAALGIPTTRAATLVTSSSTVVRDPQYDGHPVAEACAVVTRLSPTFLRFGSYEVVKGEDEVTGQAGPSAGNTALLARLVDVTAASYFPTLWAATRGDSAAPVGMPTASGWNGTAAVPLEGPSDSSEVQAARDVMAGHLLGEVARRTARLVAGWQAVGWCHGVLNTDNMSVIGVTLDYGPYGFMDAFDSGFVCNGSDEGARYTYAKQPGVCRWNLERLADAWRAVAPKSLAADAVKTLLDTNFDEAFAQEHTRLFADKLGLTLVPLPEAEAAAGAGGHSGTAHLIHTLMQVFQATHADFTTTFRSFTRLPLPLPDAAAAAVTAACPGVDAGWLIGVGWEDVSVQDSDGTSRLVSLPTGWSAVLDSVVARCASLAQLQAATAGNMPDEQVILFAQLLKAGDPRLRPHAATIIKELELRKERGRLQGLTEEGLAAANRTAWADWLAVFAKRLQADAEAVIGADGGLEGVVGVVAARQEVQVAACPRYVLRNYIAQAVIAAAEKGDAGPLQEAQALMLDPFSRKLPPSRDAWFSGFSPQLHMLQQLQAGKPPSEDLAQVGMTAPASSLACTIPGKIVAWDEVPPAWATGLCVTCSS